MKKWFLIWYALTVCLGVAWHFFYDWCPHPLMAFFAPIDESVWEHLKLLYWPVLPAALILGKQFDRKAVTGAFLSQMLWMPVFLLAVYYIATAGLGITAGWFNIGLYIASIGIGFIRAYRLTLSRRFVPRLGELLMVTAIYGCVLVLFTVASPPLPIFQTSFS